jgi:general secretion pathway protein K
VDADGEPDEASIGHLERLLLLVGAQPRWARIMADWIDTNTLPGIPEGAEDSTYLSQNPPYRTANTLVSTTTEMMALPGMTREEFERIRPFLAALPVGTPVNLCTAKAPVLASLVEGGTDFGDAELLSKNRSDGCFPTLADLEATLDANTWQALEHKVSESSDWFRAVTAVRIGTSEFTLYSLIERNESASIRTVVRSTGTE